MGVKRLFTCDLTGHESTNQNDFVQFQILRDSEWTSVVISEAALKEAMEDEETLSQIVLFEAEETSEADSLNGVSG